MRNNEVINKCLIVDDDLDICEVLCESLERLGFDCSSASNGHEALVKIKSTAFGVVLLDIRLPDMSGLDILKRIRMCKVDALPIMISAVDDSALAVDAMKLGAVDYLVKPFTTEELIGSIKAALAMAHQGTGRKKWKSSDDNAHGNTGSQLDDIARGVELRYDLTFGYSRMITEEAALIARQLGFSRSTILNWVQARSKLDFNRRQAIEHSLDKLKDNFLAQDALGVMALYSCTQKSEKSQN